MRKLILALFLLAITFFGISFDDSEEYMGDISSIDTEFSDDSLKILKPELKHSVQMKTIVRFLTTNHYQKTSLSDDISSKIFDDYIQSLDPQKSYFNAEDIKSFEPFRYELDDQIVNGNLEFAYYVFSVYRKKALERTEYIFKLLEKEFDFSKDEEFDFDREDNTWATTEEEQNEIWRKIIKNQSISYKLAGKEWEEIAKALTKRYERIQKSFYQYNSEDVFQVYVNSYTSVYDPHTNYFSPPDAENFQINMSLSLEGIGARLVQNLDYTQIVDVVPGGPAYKSNQLKKDDKIIGVAQGDEGEFVDVIGWRLDDVVAKIRGPKGSVVRLQILKSGQVTAVFPDTLRLVRDKINLESQAAKSEIIPMTYENQTYSLGVITIPSFYIDFEGWRKREKDYRSTTRDVKALITELTTQGIDGLMIDLRYNGGGSLQEAIEMTGLFVPEGPIVQVRDTRKHVDVYKDEDKGKTFYDGPLAVLTNRASASASEIFSGAIQDYKRGVIVGESTYGKGTVQNIIELKKFVNHPSWKLGQVKMTIAKFYRVTGSSNQRVGIIPDVQFPSIYSLEEYGEGSRPNALPWDEIKNANFHTTNHISEELIEQLNVLYRKDLNTEGDLKKLLKKIEERKLEREKTTISLNLEARKNIQEEKKSNNDDEGEMTAKVDEEVSEEDKRQKELEKDPYLKEGLRLLAEVVKKKIG